MPFPLCFQANIHKKEAWTSCKRNFKPFGKDYDLQIMIDVQYFILNYLCRRNNLTSLYEEGK